MENFGLFPKELLLFPPFISFEPWSKNPSDFCPPLFSSRT
ncbi:hypothetical protein HMPREF9517_01676 [Enterococcus faecalis TX1341]|nr:hypothetical protein HMPREF9517_01676 [Enterococcus faecalis TX1341]